MAHIAEVKTIEVTAAQYAKLINRSVRTAQRIAQRMQASKLARKNVYGQWAILVDVRYFKAAMVHEHRVIGARVKNTPWGQPIAHFTARREAVRECLIVLGGSDIIVELDRQRINAGVQTTKCRTEYKLAGEAIERMIAA